MRLTLRRGLTDFVIAGILVVLSAGIATGQKPNQAEQIDTQGGIAVKATYVTPAYFKAAPRDPLIRKVDLDRTVVFAVVLDTHSGDLSKFDLVKNAILRNDGGRQVAPLQWVATADGTHHRAGGLVFPKTDKSGGPIDGQARSLELSVRDLGGVAERTLRWTLPVQ
jgi:hypothetical protein